ncbi:MAG: hypothetical protein JO293_03540 [Candidatus Eremiobacteraeota bacterium]|nr:hypothetical protein [Candidatus Eremiobacteraeota bacterium]MBV8280946.1 hypothetical protein [Candidatus Eremiobacteraeota bacterium]
MKELRQLWIFGVVLAIVFFLILQTMLGWSWDAWTIGFVVVGLLLILWQWYRRFPRGY